MHKISSLDQTDYQYMADQLNKAGEMAKKAGLTMGYHNHFWEFKEFGNGTKGLDILLAFTDPDLVTFELDMFWINKADRKSTRLNSSHVKSSYAVFCLKKKTKK